MPHPRPSWPRRLRRVCLFLLVGLGTTVGVAWGLAVSFEGAQGLADLGSFDVPAEKYIGPGTVHRIWSFGAADTPGLAFKKDNRWVALAWSIGGKDAWGSMGGAEQRWREQRPRLETVWDLVTGPFEEPYSEWGVDEARGWPALSLWCGVDNVASLAQVQPPDLYGAVPLPLKSRTAADTAFRALPLLPIWPGLAFNTLFYALLWWLALASVRLVKHNHRYRHGLCPVCRYDLRADYSQGCSECGWGRRTPE